MILLQILPELKSYFTDETKLFFFQRKLVLLLEIERNY